MRRWAIKLGKIRVLRAFSRIITIPFSSQRRQHFYEKYGSNIGQALKNDLMAGPMANRIEYEYWLATSDPRVMPTVGIWLGGLVIVQIRGADVDMCDAEFRELLRKLFGFAEDPEIGHPQQYCQAPWGEKVLVDYGRSDTIEILRRTAHSMC